jgi:hypothetical protein
MQEMTYMRHRLQGMEGVASWQVPFSLRAHSTTWLCAAIPSQPLPISAARLSRELNPAVGLCLCTVHCAQAAPAWCAAVAYIPRAGSRCTHHVVLLCHSGARAAPD